MDTRLVYDPNKLSCSKPLHIGKTVDRFYKSLLDVRKLDDAKKGKEEEKEMEMEMEMEKEKEKEEQDENEILNAKIVACLKKYNKYVSADHFQDVEERCSIQLLQSPNDQKVLNFSIIKARKLYVPQEPLDADLETLHNLRKFKQKIKESKLNINLTMERYLKYRSNIMIEPELLNNSAISRDDTNVSLITIRTYHPYRHEIGKVNVKGNPKFDREFKVLSTTSLKQFREALTCRQDLDSGKENSSRPSEPTYPDDLGMGLFYINGILYIDDRFSYQLSHEYAKDLQKWGTRKKLDIRVFDMNNLCFQDIYVRLGYPNLYQHKGCCEHLFVFADIECLSNEMAVNTRKYNYPYISFIHADTLSYCSVCSKFVATWITLNNKRTVTTETLWCQTCFIRYNYTSNSEKIGIFEAYRFFS